MTKVNQCSICNHGGGEYSLTLNIENAHVSMGTWGTHSGNVVGVSIFGMSVDNMYELAQRIIDAANSISSKGLDND